MSLTYRSYRLFKRTVILVIGGTITLIGVALLVLPGPAIVVLPIGLSVLGVEFAWARRWLRKLKQSADNGWARLRGQDR